MANAWFCSLSVVILNVLILRHHIFSEYSVHSTRTLDFMALTAGDHTQDRQWSTLASGCLSFSETFK